MHEVSLGGTLIDYLTGEARERTTYEDLRQALARFLVEERGYARELLKPRFVISYNIEAAEYSREADIAVFSPSGQLLLLLLFCPGQVHTYTRELMAMARLALPAPSPLGVVTDMREAELVATRSGEILAHGLAVLPSLNDLESLALAHPVEKPTQERRNGESRILHAYTGFLKSCCGESCSFP